MNRENIPLSALSLTVVLVLVYALQVFTGFDPAYSPAVSPAWKFITSIFGHSGLEHLFNNLFFIGIFGSLYSLYTSDRVFWLTFVSSALVGNLSAFLFFPNSFIIGASGGAIGILAALAVYRPHSIGLALGVPLPMWAVLIVYIFTNLAGLTASNGVAYEAHLMGMLAGAVVGYWLRDSKYSREKDDQEDEEVSNWQQRIRDWEEKYML